MSLVRGALLAGRFRTQHELNGVSDDGQRSILIVEIAGRTNQSGDHFKAMNDFTLAGAGAVYVSYATPEFEPSSNLRPSAMMINAIS